MILLASQSPQRSALLQRAGITFRVVPSRANEDAIHHSHPQAKAVERARAKAIQAVVDGQPRAVILGADTVVSLGQEELGKPANREDAVRILTRLQGTTHTVATAHCLYLPAHGESPAREAIGVALARITMREMTEQEIRAYVDSGESDGRAGAYAIQETGDRFVSERQGEFDTVVGLSVSTVKRLYRELTGHELEPTP